VRFVIFSPEPQRSSPHSGRKSTQHSVQIPHAGSDIALTDLRDKLKAAPGTRLTLSVVRDGAAPEDKVLVLSDLI
jgi:hypothetical protein